MQITVLFLHMKQFIDRSVGVTFLAHPVHLFQLQRLMATSHQRRFVYGRWWQTVSLMHQHINPRDGKVMLKLRFINARW